MKSNSYTHIFFRPMVWSLKMACFPQCRTMSGWFWGGFGGEVALRYLSATYFQLGHKTPHPLPPPITLLLSQYFAQGGSESGGWRGGGGGGGWKQILALIPTIHPNCWNTGFLCVKRTNSESTPLHGRPNSRTLLLEFPRCLGKREKPQSGWHTKAKRECQLCGCDF